jgi:hypothetical protein
MNAADAIASLLVATGIPGLPFLDVQRAPFLLLIGGFSRRTGN